MPPTTRPTVVLCPGKTRAFTSVQLCLVLLCTVLLAGLITGLVKRNRAQARCDAFLEDISVFSKGLRAAKPSPEADFVAPDKRWHEETPFGGNYRWINPYPPSSEVPGDKNLLGAIFVCGFPPRSPVQFSQNELEYLQDRLGRKPLPGVKFSTGFNGWPLCLVYSTP